MLCVIWYFAKFIFNTAFSGSFVDLLSAKTIVACRLYLSVELWNEPYRYVWRLLTEPYSSSHIKTIWQNLLPPCLFVSVDAFIEEVWMSIPIRIELQILESVGGRILKTRFNLLYQTSRTPLHNYKIAFTSKQFSETYCHTEHFFSHFKRYLALLLIVNFQS